MPTDKSSSGLSLLQSHFRLHDPISGVPSLEIDCLCKVRRTSRVATQMQDKLSRDVRLEGQLHTGPESRRSRSAANFNASRIFATVNSGKSDIISSSVIPAARYSRTS